MLRQAGGGGSEIEDNDSDAPDSCKVELGSCS